MSAQMTAKLSLIVPFCLVIAGCASSDERGWSYKHVLVSVVDDESGKPVRGAAVSATYMEPNNPNKPITDENGKAMLKVASRPRGEICIYTVGISNNLYDQNIVEEREVKGLPKRSENFIPTKPDVVLKLTSRVTETRRKEEIAAKDKAADAAAEMLFRDSPNFWPGQRDEPSPSPSDEISRRLIGKRWERASTQELGTKDDADAIRAVVIRHMKNPKAQIHEIRWISAGVVMAWTRSFEADYFVALKKTDAGWTVVAFYMEGVS